MLKRMGKTPLEPVHLLSILAQELDGDVKSQPVIGEALSFLQEKLESIENEEKVVCHCDINHNNWLLTESNQLYLIDWDGAMIADPAIDLGLMLYWYLPQEKWGEWLDMYDIELTDDLLLRMKWYTIAQTISSIQWHKNKERFEEMNYWVNYLTTLVTQEN
jgi:thiamine kinase-like enzyme